MSSIRITTSGEGRWHVAYTRYLAQQRDTIPNGNHEHYGFIPPERQAVLREDADQLARDLIDNTEKFPTTAAYRLLPGEEEAA